MRIVTKIPIKLPIIASPLVWIPERTLPQANIIAKTAVRIVSSRCCEINATTVAIENAIALWPDGIPPLVKG